MNNDHPGMHHTHAWTAILFIAGASLVLVMPSARAATGAQQQLEVRFSPNAISVANMTHGGSAVVYGIARVAAGKPPVMRVARFVEVLNDDDRDGIVRLELKDGVPAAGIWAVVDTTTGAHQILPTPGYTPTRIAFTQEVLKKDNAGQLKKFEWPTSELELLVVRPGDGAWRIYAAKSSTLDENRGTAGRLKIDAERLMPIGNRPALKHIKNGDILAIIDPDWMRYGILEVGK